MNMNVVNSINLFKNDLCQPSNMTRLVNICPPLELHPPASAACFQAMEVLKADEIQTHLITDVIMPQFETLNKIYNNVKSHDQELLEIEKYWHSIRSGKEERKILYYDPCQVSYDIAKYQSKKCPPLELQRPPSAACLKAIDIFKNPIFQETLTEGVTPPSILLNKLYQNLNSTSFLNNMVRFLQDKRLDQEIERLNQVKSYKIELISKDMLLHWHILEQIDATKLLPENHYSQNLLTKIFQSCVGLTLAKPGDKDILLYVNADPATDYNGFIYHSFLLI